MGLFSGLSVKSLLEAERPMLDEIFGEGAYQIEDSSSDHAVVRSDLLDASFGRERDGEIGANVRLRDPPAGTCADAGTWSWLRFLEVNVRSRERDKQGKVRSAPAEQVRNELNLIAKLIAEVLSDPQKRRDAAFYVEGYQRAYTDWASGKWSPDAD